MDLLGEDEIRRFLTERIATRCQLPLTEVDPDRPLEEFGLSSRDAVAVAGELETLLGRELGPTLVWEYPTINRLARGLVAAPPAGPAADRRADPDEPVAVIGVGCRLPGSVRGPEDFWRLLLAGGDAVGLVPEGRWDAFDDGSPATAEVLARTTRHGGFLDDVAGFDAGFFGIAPGEAETMDPQQRLLLETAWEALEHSGVAPRSLRGSRTGAFVGISGNEYAYLTTADAAKVDAWTATGAAFSIAANRLSYLLDLRGPSLSVDTACSSSLVATHLAVRSLRSGESDLALAAGVNLLLSPVITMAFDQGGGTAPDGRCKSFDASADGMVRAEGCGVAVLKRLSDAQRDGDRILAVIRSTAVNQDGRSNGLVAPNPEAQEELLRAAYAGLAGPDYVEAHGTGTFLGDPIEARALDAALCGGRDTPLLIGSAKSNLGHLEAAAGITGLIKTVLSLHHGVIPPSIHFHQPNPHIPWDRLKVVTAPTPWPGDRPRAGVSSFGFGGTNAHVVLDRAPNDAAEPPGPAAPHDEVESSGPSSSYGERHDRPGSKVFLLTDVSAERVRDHAGVLADWIGEDGSGIPLDDVAYTLARRAGRGRAGAALVAGNREELVAGLRAVREGGGVTGAAVVGGRGPVWVFSGYGSQWAGMGARLYAGERVFAEAVDELDPMFREEAGIGLREIVAEGREATGVVTAQPLIFAVQVALARVWVSHGIRPAAVIGHSMGEVAAAVVAGGIGLRDAVRVICRRAGLLGTLGGGGAMAVLEVAADEVPDDLHVAVYASPKQCVVTGDPDRVTAFASEVGARGLLSRVLTAEGAGHSPQVKPLLPKLRAALATIAGGKPEIPFYSTVFDDPREVPTFEPAYWAAGVRRPVRLLAAVRAAAEDGHSVFTEISPHPVLAAALRDTLPSGTVITHSLRRGHDEELSTQLAATVVALPALAGASSGRLADLPSSPWRHENHWARAARRAALPPGSHPLLGVHVESPAGHVWTTTLDDLCDVPWRLDPSAWRVHGLPILPLAAVAALAQAAAFDVRGRAELTDVTLNALLPLPATITTTLTPSGEVEIDAKNAAGVWVRYGTATITSGPPQLETIPSPAELDERLRGAPEAEDGRSWGPEEEPRAEDRRSWEPEKEPEAERPRDPEAERPGDVARVPIEIERLGQDGTPAGVLSREIPATAVPVPLAGKLVARVWTPSSGVEAVPAGNGSDPRPARGWLIVAGKGDSRAGRLASGLVAAGHAVHRLTLPGMPRAGSTPSLVPAQRPAPHTTRPAASVTVPANDEVVVLVPGGLNPAGAEALFLAVTRIAGDLAGTGSRLRLVTDRAQAVLASERGDPGAAALRGLLRVLAFEHPDLRVCLVDVDDPDVLLAELTADTPDDEVAWRNGVRYTARLSAIADPGSEVPPAGGRPGGRSRVMAGRPVVRRGGGYLITGGYGGLGLVVARWLAERGAGRIVLSGRSGPSAEGAETIERLRGLGVDVQVVAGDLAVPGVARGLVDAVRADGVRLHGVVHAAGVLDDHLVADIGPEDLHRVWSAKVHGGLALHEATRDVGLDWWVAFSSAAALIGSPGQAAYAGANAWLDALCDLRRSEGLPGTTINWGTWAEVGGASQTALPAVSPLTPDEGVEALEALLARGTPAAGVLRLDAATAVAVFPGIARMPYFADLAGAVPADGDWAGGDALTSMEPEQALEVIFAKIAERTAVVLGFETTWLRESTVLTEAGLDSLAATRVRGTIEHDFGVAVPTALLLQGATLGDVVRAVAAELGIHGIAGTRPVEPRDAAERQVVAALTRILGHEPGVTDEIPADVLPAVLDVLGQEAGRPFTATGVLTGAQVADLLREVDEEEAAQGVIRPLTEAAREYLAARRAGAVTVPASSEGGRARPEEVPLFLGHPAGGTTGVYSLLARGLGPGRVVFGLERLDDVGPLGAEPGVSERAARYVEEIRKVQPAGPYRLGGWSFGGILAFEIARQLGTENVELVAMIDSGLPDEVAPAERRKIIARRYADFAAYLAATYGVRVRLTYDELTGLGEADQLTLVETRVAESGVLELLGEAILRHQITSHSDTRALEGYRAGTYEGRVVLYRSTDPTPWAVEDVRYAHADDPTRGFGPFSPGLEIVTVPGSHHLNLLDPPHVEVIAAHLGGQL
ncbi:SDR family NAD(P)-dependent oxidoreductase [Streptosporangium sp. NPDC000396]|uniref:SDR family NAD(P)-dependent oxidoreductase n=1 Tax=Streptosporangium sp. NPDC000396 TaxID=3366185 RepID=UPI0036A74429